MASSLPPALVTTPDALRRGLGTRGLVPTMGALHAGHQSLIARAAADNDEVVVSIFVNPTQFNDPADLARYPRDLMRDVSLAGDAGATVVYAPDASTMYPQGFATTVHLRGSLTERWEGASRPGHFDGVATVVSILLNQVRPDRSYFGEKDFQQLTVVRRLHRDLALPGIIVGCPTIREDSGLAMSSRNARLTPHERDAASTLWRTLFILRKRVSRGETNTAVLLEEGRQRLSGFELDYLAIVAPDTLVPVDEMSDGSRAIVAARIGTVRLLDTLDLVTPSIVADRFITTTSIST